MTLANPKESAPDLDRLAFYTTGQGQRPVSPYDKSVVVPDICNRLAKGETLSRICKDDGMPTPMQVWNWCAADPTIALALARARDVGFDHMAEDCYEIADDSSRDSYEDEAGRRRVDDEVVQRSKLRIWTRLELLKVWCPKRYGAKVAVEHSGTVTQVTASDVRKALQDCPLLAEIEQAPAIVDVPQEPTE